MTQHITILNGPNLNLLGKRQPKIYGSDTLDDVAKNCAAIAKELGLTSNLLQTNYEGQLIDWIQEARDTSAGIIINPAALSHTSIGVLDALNTFDGPVIEVHISNIHQREEFRHYSYVSERANGIIVGCGVNGYALAMRQIAPLLT